MNQITTPKPGELLADLVTIEGLAASYPETLSVDMLKWQLRHRHENGLALACMKVGKRMLISRTRYESWLAAQFGA